MLANSELVTIIRFVDRKRDWKSDRRKSKVGCKQNPIQTSSTQENVKCVECRALHGWWLHAAGLFCKCHSFGRWARAVVKTNLVGIGFLILWFSFHCEQLIWNPYRVLLYYIFYRSRPSRHTLFIPTSSWKLKTKQFYENSTVPTFPISAYRFNVFPRQDWCVDRSIVLGDDAWG